MGLGGSAFYLDGRPYQVVCIAKQSETQEELVVYQALYGEFECVAKPSDLFFKEQDGTKGASGRDVERGRRGTGFERKPEEARASCGSGREEAVPGGIAPGQEDGEREEPEARFVSGGNARNQEVELHEEPEGGLVPGGIAPGQEGGERKEPEARFVSGDDMREQEVSGNIRPDRESESEVGAPGQEEAGEERANPVLLEFLDADTLEQKYQILKSLRDSITNRLIDDFAVVLDLVIPDGDLDVRYQQLLNSVRTRQKYENSRFIR